MPDALLPAILDAMVNATVVTDARGIIHYFNPAAQRLFGYSAEEVVGTNVNCLMPSPHHEAHDQYLANYLATGERKIIGIGREVHGKRKDGQHIALHLSIGEASVGPERWFVAVLVDITEKQQAESRLLTLSRAVEQSPNAIMITSVDGVVEYVNTNFSRLTGYSAEDVVGQHPPPLQVKDTRAELRLAKAGDSSDSIQLHGEIEGQKKSGERYWALQTVAPIRTPAGKIVQFLTIQQDITELKREKRALEESEGRFRQMANMAGEWLWEQDPEGRYIYSSGAVYDILGYEPQAILGKTYLDLLTPEDRQRWSQPAFQNNAKPFAHLSNRYQHRDGRIVFTESTGAPIFDANGTLLKWRGIDQDVTGRRRYEDALKLRDRAIEAASVGINIVPADDPEFKNIYVNPALCRISGYTSEELLNHGMHLLQGADTDPKAIREISRTLREGRECQVVLKNYRKDGTGFWNELRIAPVQDEDGRLTHFIGVQTDVTELRRAAEERHELEIAKQIQLSLLPKHPLCVAGIAVAGICQPATHVGGDYFDYFQIDDNLDVVIADVSGHSVGAALIMAEARSALHAETRSVTDRSGKCSPGEILALLNSVLYEDLSGADLFISMFYLRLNLVTRSLTYASAGHNCPLLHRSGTADFQPLDAEGMILGVNPLVEFEERTLTLAAGDRIFLCTDGLMETRNEAGEFFEAEALQASLRTARAAPPAIAVEQILNALHEFRGTVPVDDDISLAILDVAPSEDTNASQRSAV